MCCNGSPTWTVADLVADLLGSTQARTAAEELRATKTVSRREQIREQQAERHSDVSRGEA